MQRAALRMADGDLPGALAALDRADPGALSPAGRYLRGRVLFSLGRYEEAASALPERPGSLPDAVWHDAQLRRAEARVKANACDRVSELLANLRGSAGSPPQPFLWSGQCALAENDADHAVEFLEEALSRDPKGRRIDRLAAQLLLAQAQQARGEEANALDLLRELYIYEPADRRAEEVVERIRTLTQRADPRKPPLPMTRAEQVTRAHALYESRAYEEAAELLATLGPPKDKAGRAGFLHLRGMALFRTRNHYAQAARVLARAARIGGEHAKADAFHAARALARADRDRAAVRALGRFLKRNPRGAYAAHAAYLRAWLGMRHRFAGSRRHMERFVDSPLSRRVPGERSEGVFQLAMDAFNRRRMRQAKRRFLEYAEGRGEMLPMRGLYWAARAAAASGSPDEALDLYRQAIAAEPHHYYGQLAAHRLAEHGVEPPPALPAAGEPAEVAAAPLPAEVALYARLGLIEDAARRLRRLEPKWLRGRKATLDRVLPWAVRYAAMGNHRRAHQLIAPFWPSLRRTPAQGTQRVAWRLTLARPVPETVGQACRRFSVEAELVYAIMRKESGFHAGAVSYANAFGLMQLLPETAARVDGDPDSDAFDRRRLLMPSENVRLGAKYLAGLLRRYPQHPAPAIAAYNAGTQHVDDWLRRERRRKTKAVPFDLFVERIPITQTRNYVRRVLTNWARYRYLAGLEPVSPWSLVL